jgi:hypothetical protein
MDITIFSSFLPHDDFEAAIGLPDNIRDRAVSDPAGNMVRIQEAS